MLGSGSAGNSALVATDHCKILVDGGLSARQLVLRLEQRGVMPEQIDGVLLTHEHGDHICGLEVLCRKFDVPIYCNALTAEAVRSDRSFERHRNWRIFATGAEFSICDITVQTFPVPHDAVDPLGFAFHAGSGSLGFITDLGYVTKMIVERLRRVQTLVIETNHDEKLLQNDTHRPWPVKQRIQSRHGHLSNAAAAGVIEELLPGKIERVVTGKVRQGRGGNPLRYPIRNQSAISHRRNQTRSISTDFRERIFPKRWVAHTPRVLVSASSRSRPFVCA
jgi:phosphoribosyl 1,2-cyclic phosphodiesterase